LHDESMTLIILNDDFCQNTILFFSQIKIDG